MPAEGLVEYQHFFVDMGLTEEAWIAASVHHGASEIRSGHVLEALLD